METLTVELKFQDWYEKHKGNDYHTASMVMQYKRIFMEGYFQCATESYRYRTALELIVEDNFPDSPVSIAKAALEI